MFRQALGKLKQWVLQEPVEPRREPRSKLPEVVVYYWDGSVPEGRHIRDISASGAYILTPENWYPGTIVRIILQGYHTSIKPDGTTSPTATISIQARVVRHGSDGVAVEFVFQDEAEEQRLRGFLASIPPQPMGVPPSLNIELAKTSPQKGQALVEFALMIPLVFLLAVNAVNFGGFFFAWITVADAARVGVQYMVMSSASPGSPTRATQAQITAVVAADISSMLNRASLVVATCDTTLAPFNCNGLVDPEAPAFALAAVDVTYTYTAFIPLFAFPKLGIYGTIPPTAIHRKAVMRMLQ